MKAALKRSFSFLLCLVMLAGLFPPAAMAEDAPAQPGVESSADYRLEASSTLGQVFTNSLGFKEGVEETDGGEAVVNQISRVNIENGEITVGYTVLEEAELVVAYYEDPGEVQDSTLKLLDSMVLPTDMELCSTTVSLPEGLPAYYLVGAFLLRSGSHEPLCEEYICSLYTKRYQDFIHAPLSDFEQAGERLLVLAEGKEADGSDWSFAVFSEDVIRFRESETENHLIENEDGSFTFTDPDDALLAIRVGDKLAHTALDGSVTVILVLSRTLDEDTGALTLTHDENTEAVDFFETVRIHAKEDPNAAPIVDTDSGAPGVEYLPEESVSDEVEQIFAQVEAGGDAPLYAGTGEAVVMDAPGDATEFTFGTEVSFKINFAKAGSGSVTGSAYGKVSLAPEVSIKLYLNKDIAYVYVGVSVTFSINLGLSGTLGDAYSLHEFIIPSEIPGISGVLSPEIVLEFTASLTYVAKWTIGAGVEYDSTRPKGDNWHPVHEVPTLAPKRSLKAEGKVSIGFQMRFGVKASMVDYFTLGAASSAVHKSSKKTALLEADIVGGVNFELTATLPLYVPVLTPEPSDSEIHECSKCLEGKTAIVLHAGYEVSALYGIVEGGDGEALKLTIPLGNFYYSYDKDSGGPGLCPHRRFKLTLTAIDGINYDFGDLAFHDYEQVIKDNDKVHRLSGAVMSLREKSGKYVQTTDLITGEDGSVSVFVPSGEYYIRSYTDSGYGELYVKVDGSPREVRLLLKECESETGTIGSLVWSFYQESGLLAISGKGEMPDFADFDDTPWADKFSAVRSIVIRPGVESIGDNAFRSCISATELGLPTGLRRIGKGAFTYLNFLPSVSIPASMEEIGENAFFQCTGLKTVYYDGSYAAWKSLLPQIGQGNDPLTKYAELKINSSVVDRGQCGDSLFWSLSSTGALSITGSGDMDAYSYDSIPWATYRTNNDIINIEEVIIDYGVTSISSYAFAGIPGLTEVQIPATVTVLPTGAFWNCTNLTTVELEEGIESIGERAFCNCRKLSAINLPYSLTKIEACAFQSCRMGSKKSEEICYEGTDHEWATRVNVDITDRGNDPLLNVLTTYSDNADESGECGINLTYILSDSGALILEGSGEMHSAPWKSRASDITSVRLPEGLESIISQAFAGCKNLKKLTIPQSVEEIGLGILYGCSELTSLTTPFVGSSRGADTNSSSGTGTFCRLDGFFKYYSGSSYTGSVPANLTTVHVTKARDIAQDAFSRSYAPILTNVTLNKEIETIGSSAFYGQNALEHITLPDNLNSIGASSFYGCTSLQSISIPDSVRIIRESAFCGCSSLTEMPIPASVKTIGTEAFGNCTGLKVMTIPDTVESIGLGILYGCSNLTTLTVPFVGSSRGADTNSISGTGTFCRLDGFFKYYASVNSYTGSVPSSLTAVTVTNATHIADEAFRANNYAPLLTELTLNDGITSIGVSAFAGQRALTSLPIPPNVTSIGAEAYYGCSSVTDAVIPDGVTAINAKTFFGCSSLTQMPIPASVKTIGTEAFGNCTGLKVMTIPDTVESIGLGILYGCSNLTTLTVPYVGSSRGASTNSISGTGTFCRLDGFFKYYASVNSYTGSVPSSLTAVTVTNATHIADEAFRANNYAPLLTELTLNDGITSIGVSAFAGQSRLQELYFDGTMAQWQAISIAGGNTPLYGIPIHCLDGDLTMDPANALEAPEELENAEEAEATTDPAGSNQGESGGSIGPVEPTIEPAPTEEPDPVIEPMPTEEPDPVIEPVPTEDPGCIGLASFSGEGAPVDDTIYSASFAGLVPGEQYVLLITEEDVENLDLRFASLLFIAQGAAGEDGTLRFSYVRLPSEKAPVIRLYGRSDKDLGDAEALGLVMHKGVSDPNAYSVHVSYEGTELKENEDYILSIEKQEEGVIAVTVKGIRAYSGSRTVLAKETCLEAAETADGYAVIHTAHTWGEWSESTATCEAPGEKARSCSVCGKTESESTEPIGHLWGEPIWTWSEDLASAEASFTCAHDSSHVTTLEASISQAEEDEYGVFYTAAVTFQGRTYSDSRYLRLFLPGDLNRDGEVDSGDLLRLRQMLVGTETLSPAADLNGDGEVDLLDLVRFRKYLAGEDVILFDPKA